MRIYDYLKINKLWFISNLAILMIVNCIMFSSIAINNTLEDIIYMDVLIIIIEIITIIYGFRKSKIKYDSILKEAEGKNIQREACYKGDFYVDTILEIKRRRNEEFYMKEEDYKRNINELQEYITQWVHDVKVNIAVCELLLEDIENVNTSKLCSQIEQIRFNVNQVLHVTRANHYNQDIIAEEFDISEEIKSAIRDNALFFINKNIKITTEIETFMVTSDKKWIHYIICQILNNCSKYTPNSGEITITSIENKKAYCLYIKDSGIGIQKEDINRIFNKGFTGKNGRTMTKSTGMGLYYAKKMAENLSIGIDVKSEEGKYTEFIISFYKLSDYYNITAMSH
ncbi:sensor histidine kinase [Abyssisolibacter fermentans]|uniref:sensor histidine kinase n=1 Tax=Abyssisolibacter fermentans TaxID=1766203 RepID=UPI00082CE770|nr:sensor histidine kinase [Abyssisolibacter fermentans]